MAARDAQPSRLFIGPLPAKLLPAMHDMVQLAGPDDPFDNAYAAAVRDALDRNAHAFFVRQGGRTDDWDDDARAGVRDELVARWESCPWTSALRHRRGLGASHWVGTTFDVGSILGVYVLDAHAPAAPPDPKEPPAPAPPPADGHAVAAHAPYASTTALSSTGYWTVRSHPSSPSPGPSQGSGSTASLPEHPNLSAFSSGVPLLTGSTPALPSEQPPTLRSILKRPSRAPSKPRTKRRGVHLLDRDTKSKGPLHRAPTPVEADVKHAGRSMPAADERTVQGPVSPTAVLARTGNEVAECSAGATAEGTPAQVLPDGIFLRDRMLVRVCHTRSESLTNTFDEAQNRQTTHLRMEECMEFLVVWRKDMLELYEDYTLPGKEYVTGHKCLTFVVPLASERTSVSLYSFVDLTFCVLCPPTPVCERYSRAASFFDLPKEGTNVFVFKVKSRSRARDWLWHLWHRLGGKIPTSIDIRYPDADVCIRMDVPAPEVFNLDKAYEAFSRKYITDLVQRSLPSEHTSAVLPLGGWKTILRHALKQGKKLELAWRFGGQLDWAWQAHDVEGNARPWDILSGLSLVQGLKRAHLELRIAEHFPDRVHTQTGTKLLEPPAVEGYLDRIKQQGRHRVYLVTHGGSLFSLLPPDANPPLPPSAHLSRLISGLKPSVDEYGANLFESEVWRGAEQIRAAHGTVDLRSIRVVRRAYQPPAEDDGDRVAQDAVDARDTGEHHGGAQSQKKAEIHLRRTFEIVLVSERVIRYETYSAPDCIEWVTRLRALVAYWSQRHLVDVKDQMDAAFVGGARGRLTPRTAKCAHRAGHGTPSEPPMSSEPPVLLTLYNWCPLSACRSIVKAGRVFTRKGVRGQYRLVQMFLVAGRLVLFNVSPGSFLHHRDPNEIVLLDAYVCSGYFAALALRRAEYNPESANLPRRYDDGLETDERDEDVLFVIWYRKSAVAAAHRSNAPSGGFQPTQPVPGLSKGSLTLRVFRTRSKVERDAWCWALGCEIEKVVRNNMAREGRVREAGRLVQLPE